VHLDGEHTVQDVTIAGASASDNKSIKLSADYEFRRNILVQFYGSYTDSRFTGTARTDDYPGAGVTVTYLLNRYLSAHLGYDFGQRSSNFAPFDFTDNMLSVGVKLHV
jgi:hypothetical protein